MPPVPRFTIVSAVYDVARYLPEFIASIEAQTFPLDRVEVIMVDDGSTDESPRLLAEWQQRRPELVTVLTKTNGGQASARNLGIEHATGEWVTMPDPDDFLAANYLAEVDAFLTAHPDTELVGTNRIVWHEDTRTRTKHPLNAHFAYGDRLRNLDDHPTFFFGSAPAAFFRTAVLHAENLRLDERIRPNFEDGHFCTTYLLRAPAPLVAFLSSAEYFYRVRGDSSSTVDTSRLHVGRYTAVLRHGYLDVLRQAEQRLGRIPAWVQNFVLYELSWYFWGEGVATRQSVAVEGVADEFHGLLADIAHALDPQVVRSFAVRPFRPVWREILLHGYDPQPWHTPYAVVDKVDLQQRTMRVTYRFTHDAPTERFTVDGIELEPLHAKVRDEPYFRRVLVHERIAWLPYGTLTLELDGEPVELVADEPANPRYVFEAWRARDAHHPKHREQARDAERRRLHRSRRQRTTLWLARTKAVRLLFRHAWVLIDRVHDADDSAEHLFRWLRRHRRRVNAWFVLERGTADHRRLHRRHPWRVLAYGSLRWKLAMINAQQLISTHADIAVTHPKEVLELIEEPSWRFVFLQHGVTKDDLSPWLNHKDIEVFVTSTRGEYHSLVDDGTAYRYTTREAVLTGLPRFDAIRAAARKVPSAKRDLLLVAPTWRASLVTPQEHGSQRRVGDAEQVAASPFGRNWLGLLGSERIRRLAEENGLTVALLMHPNMQQVFAGVDLPPHVARLDFTDVRHTFARARLLVTDYSSMAFNVAYVDRPVVYFQFDRDLMLAGGHVGRRGYFDYVRDGFGPLTETLDDAVAAVEEAVSSGPDPAPQWTARVAAAFPERDGRCCERTADAIAASVRRNLWPPSA